MKTQGRRKNWSLLAGIVVVALAAVMLVTTTAFAIQEKPETQPAQKVPLRQFIIVMRRGPKWIPGKGVSEQPLLKHGRYLKELMDKGLLQFAGPFLDDSGGLLLLKVADESEARRIAEHDPAVLEQILEPEIHPFRIAFDATTGESPFK